MSHVPTLRQTLASIAIVTAAMLMDWWQCRRDHRAYLKAYPLVQTPKPFDEATSKGWWLFLALVGLALVVDCLEAWSVIGAFWPGVR